MTLSLLSSQPSTLAHMTASMGNVLKLFIFLVGGGIPAGVLLARYYGLVLLVRACRSCLRPVRETMVDVPEQ